MIHIEKIITPYNRTAGNGRRIEYLVFHYTGTLAPAGNNAKYYAGQYVGASAHYYLDAGPVIYQGVEDTDAAWHCGASKYIHPACRNANSIGIEMVPKKASAKTMLATDTDWSFDPATVDHAVALGRMLMEQYSIPAERVLRHYDVTGKLCPNPFCVDAKARAAWEEFKRRLTAKGEDAQMTREEVAALVAEEVAKTRVAYQTENDVPAWGKPTVQRLVSSGVLRGDEQGRLNLTEDLLRALVVMERGMP